MPPIVQALRRILVVITFAATTLVIGSTTAPAADLVNGAVRGGQAVFFDQHRCMIGFSVEHSANGDGFVTAGPCGTVGQQVRLSPGGTPVGVVAAQTIGWLYVDLYNGWTSEPYVFPNQPVTGYGQAPVGSSVCSIGPTTGVHCGTIAAHNQTVHFPTGTVTGLTRTDVCGEPGMIGAPFLSNGQAQGVALGGSGDCTTGGTTYIFPMMPVVGAGLLIKTV